VFRMTAFVSRHVVGHMMLILAFTGCAARLPKVPWRGPDAAIDTVAARFDQVQTMTARCEIALARKDGTSILLDGALAVKREEGLRLRAWKFGAPVFDFTARNDGVWLWTSDAGPMGTELGGLPGENSGTDGRWVASAFDGRWLRRANADVIRDVGGRTFELQRNAQDGKWTFEIDKKTATARAVHFQTTGRSAERLLKLEDYRVIDGIAWPTRLIAEDEGGQITLRLSEVELNAEVEASALQPPLRATKTSIVIW
jgi:hypothetical protein